MAIKLIIGLANPGVKYAVIWYNAGIWCVDLLADRHRVPLRRESKFFGYTSRTDLAGEDIRLLVPTALMNLSGKAAAVMTAFYRIDPGEILTVHDELDLPPGVARLELDGGHSDHNGLKDIISRLGDDLNFHRLRVRIGRPGDKSKVVGLILGKPPASERKLIDDAVGEAACCTEVWLKNGLTEAIDHSHVPKAQ